MASTVPGYRPNGVDFTYTEYEAQTPDEIAREVDIAQRIDTAIAILTEVFAVGRTGAGSRAYERLADAYVEHMDEAFSEPEDMRTALNMFMAGYATHFSGLLCEAPDDLEALEGAE